MQNHLESYILDVFSSTDKHKAEKIEVKAIEKRVKQIEDKVLPN